MPGIFFNFSHTFQSYPHSFVGIEVLLFPILRQVSPRQFTGVLQGIAADIGISNSLRAFLMMCLNSSSSGSMKKIPRNCLALSSFGFSIAHFCFALLFAASDKCFQISGHTLSGLEVVCFPVSLSPDHENPSGGFLQEWETTQNVFKCAVRNGLFVFACVGDDSHQRDARHSHHCEDRRDAETAHCVCTVLFYLSFQLLNRTN